MTAEDARARLEAARDRHRARSPVAQGVILCGGGLVTLTGAIVLVLLPELGLPLLLVGLRLLALQFEWAARAYTPVARLWDRLKALSLRWKIAIVAAATLLVTAVVFWIA